MATKIGDAFLTLRIDRAQAEKDARTAAQGLGQIFLSSFAALEIKDVFKNSIKSASDLNVTIAASKTVFGDAQSGVEAFAKSADKNFGLSESAALRTSTAIGNLLTNLGFTQQESVAASQQLTQVAADLGAAFNKDTADVLDSITKGVAGQTRGLKQYGIVLDTVTLKEEAQKLGLYDGKGALDAHAKAAATLSLILQDASKFSGDFAASTDTVATSQRIAKAEQENASASLGQNFLPIYQKITQIVGDLAKVFGELPGPIQVGVLALAALAALSGPIGVVVGVVTDLAVAIGALEITGGEMLAIVAAIGLAAAALFFMRDSEDEVAKHSQDVSAKLDEQVQKMAATAQATDGATTAAQGFVEAQTAMSNAIIAADGHQQRLKESLGALGLTTDDAAGLMLKLQGADKLYIDSIKGATPEIRNRATAQLELIGATLRQAGVSGDATAAIVAEAGSLANGKSGVVGYAEATKGLTAEQKVLVDALLNVGKSASQIDVAQIATDYLNTQVSASKLNGTLIEQAEAQAGVSRNSSDSMKVLAAYQVLLDNLTPQQKAEAEAAAGTAQAILDVGDATDTATPSMSAWEVSIDLAKQAAEANKDATSALSKEIQDSTNEFDAAKSAADTFSKALDDVFNPALNLEEANQKLADGLRTLKDNIEVSKKELKNHSASLDANTESGSKNRTTIEAQVKTILEQAKANVAAGASVTDATNATQLYRTQLENTLAQLGFNKDQVHAYIDQLGLTPEKVATAIQLDHDEEVKKSLQDRLKQLGDISATWAAKIQADIDNGQFDAAEAKLDYLARNRPVLFVPSGNFTSGDVAGGRNGTKTALGGFFPGGTNQWRTFAEDPGPSGDEVALPLGNPTRMQAILNDPRVAGRVPNGGGGPMNAVHIEHAVFTDGTDAEAVAQVVMFKLSGAGI